VEALKRIEVLLGEIRKSEREIAAKTEEIERIRALVAEFPDLHTTVGRWEKLVYSSKLANKIATDYESRFNCGCCSDAPWEVWPYVQHESGMKIFSSPAYFFSGERRFLRDGIFSKGGWRKELRDAGIPENLIDRIGACMKDEPDLNDDEPDLPDLE
jgi:hypothetical protein